MTQSEDNTATQSETNELTDTARALIEAIERPKKSTFEERGLDGYLPKLDLPGFGEKGDTCGEDIPHFCDCCGDTFDIGRTCATSRCPRCAPAWVMRRAGSSKENSGGSVEGEQSKETPGHVAKIDALARKMSSDRGGASIKTHHLVFSPPMDSWFLSAEDPLDRTFKVIRELLQVFDAEGFVYFHPWAGDNEDHDGDDRGEWKKRLFSGRDWEGDVKDELIPRGHFHAIVCSEWIEGGESIAQMNEATDWIIKRVAKRDGSGRSLDGLEDIARAATYCLSHTGIREQSGNHYAQFRQYGSTLSNLTYCPRKDEADAKVREVAPDTLGIEKRSVRCLRRVAPDEAADTHSPTPEIESDGDAAADTTDPDPEEVELVPCDGKVRPIDDAPDFLSRPEWRAKARDADKLQSTWEDWNAGDGWPGGS